MNKLIKITGLALLISIGLGSCKKDDYQPFAEVQHMEPVGSSDDGNTGEADFKMAGVWIISNFEWHNKEPNHHFDGYEFSFSETGVVYAVFRNNTWKGTWLNRERDFKMDFGAQKPLLELNGGWFVSESGDGYLVLKGISTLDGSSQFLVFRRIR
jgi:hypothetical protein